MKNEDEMTAAELIEYWIAEEKSDNRQDFAGDKVVTALLIDTLYILGLADSIDRLYIQGFY